VAKRGRYRAMPDGLTTGSEPSVADASGEDLEEVNWVGDVSQRGIQAEGSAEAGPKVPGFIAPIAVANSDAGAGRCLRSAEISEEDIAGLKGHNCQGSVCG
jgi:hypothetical protein